LDRHVAAGAGERAALIYDSPVTGQKRTYSYRELRDTVAKLAGMIVANAVTKGNRVIAYMPMIPEAATAMLACARIGAIHSVLFGGFAASYLATRIVDAKPKMILSASCVLSPTESWSTNLCSKTPSRCPATNRQTVWFLQRPQAKAAMIDGRDIDWTQTLATDQPVDCVPVAATDPLYILYTSGTTGQPMGVVGDNGGHAVALHWSMSNLYKVAAGDVYWAASDVGWVVKHSYIFYGPLLAGCSTVMYEGKPVGTCPF
jgi:propionyl-CoA synthetase